MRSFKQPNRKQMLLLTQVSMDSVAPVGSALRCIDELVDQLDTSEIERRYDLDSEHGREPFHPKTLIKVALYALHNCRFTLRKMEEDTQKHLGYKWLTGDEAIDHSTMGYFLSRYREQIVDLFAQVVHLCLEEELVDFEVLAIDSVKVRANASYKQTRDVAGIEKEQQKIKQRLEQMMGQVGEGAAEMVRQEARRLERRAEKLEKAKQILKGRMEEKPKGKGGKDRINITDVDARIMGQANGEKNAAYSITTATDSKGDIITHFQVNLGDDDPAALRGSIQGSRSMIGARHGIVVADAGFGSVENLEHLQADAQRALIPDRRRKLEARGTSVKGDFDRSKFYYQEDGDYYICPQGVRLRRLSERTIAGQSFGCYGNRKACHRCAYKQECTKTYERIICRRRGEELKESMRRDLSGEHNQKIYNRRAHCSESPYGHIKRNLRFVCLMRRGIENVRMEMAMVFMLHNMSRLSSSPT